MKPLNVLREKLKPLDEKYESWRKNSPSSKYIIRTAVVAVSFVFGLIIGCSGNSSKEHFSGQNLAVTEAIDSFLLVMPEGANVIARFNDERHSLYYLKGGHLMRFNALSKMLEEVTPETTNANMQIYYDDMDEQSGIIAAKLSKDEKFILFTAVTQRRANDKDPLRTQNYQLNTESLNLLTYDGKALDPIPVKKDTVKTEKTAPRKEKSEAASVDISPDAGTETTVVPASESYHEEPAASEPKHEHTAPKANENADAPAE